VNGEEAGHGRPSKEHRKRPTFAKVHEQGWVWATGPKKVGDYQTPLLEEGVELDAKADTSGDQSSRWM